MLGSKRRENAIRRGFDAREPWVTRYRIDNVDYGGTYDPTVDVRVDQFHAAFPQARTVLELGSMEGGHSNVLARRLGIRVTGVEGRQSNIQRAMYATGLLGTTGIEFVQADLERRALSSFGQFDVVFCAGLLYHLPKPWLLLDGVRGASAGLFLWTHYADENRADSVVEGVPGHWYDEDPGVNPLDGLSPRSYWMTLPALVDRLKQNGFDQVDIIQDDRAAPIGPAVTLAAKHTGA